MQERSHQAERLLVGIETAFGSDEFHVDERLRVEEVRHRGDQAISTARVSVRIDDAFDSEEARRRYRPDLRLVIMTDEADAARRRMLFEGYPPVQSARWDGRIGHEDEQYVFEAEHVFERLARGRESLIHGRQVRNGSIEDGFNIDPSGFADKSVLMSALPCVFNPDGAGNRATAPLTVRWAESSVRPVHVFTWDGAAAMPWTYATALRYLLWFYLPRHGPVFAGNIPDATEGPAAGRNERSDALSAALSRAPVSLAFEGMSLAEALALLASCAGIHIGAETANAGGRPVTRLRIWSLEAGPLRCLHLVRGGHHVDGRPRYDTRGRSTAEILASNNVFRGEVTWDHRGIVNAPVVIGDVKRYEMTLPLRPGWVPRGNIDNVGAAGRAAAKAPAMTPEAVEAAGDHAEEHEWFRRYHRHGSEFHLDGDVSRLWVLNEDGRHGPELFNRNAPYDDYRPFDFSTVADETATRPGAWMRRPRRLLPAISMSSDKRRLGVWVEISFDGGATWQLQSGGVRILEDRAGIYFECDNPTEIAPTGVDPAAQNMWYAIIDWTFRVRVTAVIESDDRLMGTFPPDRVASATQHLNGMIVRAPRSYQFITRRHAWNVLASEALADDGERDDSPAIAAFAEQLARRGQERRIMALPAIPWIETGYELGDRIEEIRGRHLRFATTIGPETRYPAVLERRFVLRDGAYETQLVLGTTAPAVQM